MHVMPLMSAPSVVTALAVAVTAEAALVAVKVKVVVAAVLAAVAQTVAAAPEPSRVGLVQAGIGWEVPGRVVENKASITSIFQG